MGFPVRFLILIICAVASAVIYLDRSNINITVIAMTHHSMKVSENKSNEICPFPTHLNQSSGDQDELSKGHCDRSPKYKWDQTDHGTILGAFFYSYILFQIPGGVMVDKVGAKWIIVSGLLGSGLINLITPLIAGTFWMMVGSRILLGLLQSSVYPSIFAITCAWMPIKDRSLSFAVLESGSHLGSIITSSLSGWLSEQECGWPMVFYASGTVACIFSFIFALTVTSEPKDHRLISKQELQMIMSDDGVKSTRTLEGSTGTPWMGILTSKAVFAIFASKFAASWVYFTLGSKLPAYLSDFIHIELTKNGLLNSSMYLIAIVGALIVGYFSERIVERNWTTRTNIRKMFHAMAALGMAISMALVPSAGCSQPGLMSLVLCSWFFMEFNAGGDKPLPGEVTKNHSAIVYAIVNSTSMSTGFIAPAVIGWILSTWGLEGWKITFYLASVISLTGMVIFLSWASAERQPFDLIVDVVPEVVGQSKTKNSTDVRICCTKM